MPWTLYGVWPHSWRFLDLRCIASRFWRKSSWEHERGATGQAREAANRRSTPASGVGPSPLADAYSSGSVREAKV